MTKFNRRQILFATATTSLAALSWPERASAETTLEKIRRTGVLTVGTEASLPPYEFIKDGKIVGYGADILAEVVKALGNVQLKQLDLPFQGILPGLLAGKFDFAATTMNVNPERARRYAFTYPISGGSPYAVKRKGDAMQSPTDLNGKVVGTQLASGPEPVTRAFDAKLKAAGGSGFKELKLFTTVAETYVALANGEVDAAIVGSLNTAALLIKDRPGIFDRLGPVPTDNPFTYSGWVTRPEDTDLRDFISGVIRGMRADGRLGRLQEKWFGTVIEFPDVGYLPPGAI
ncbi:transporter substrate-binding domain-containing protein [Boseaceae bacterium BT-24-1]|nr:transporter substrate-binding domain-containing protein [Boseaceae bacterium BT-24-1]